MEIHNKKGKEQRINIILLKPKGKEAQSLGKSGPNMRRITPKPNANHLNFMQKQHRPTLEKKRISPNEIGVKVAHLGCGHTHGGGAPLVAHLGPNIVRVVSYGPGKSV